MKYNLSFEFCSDEDPSQLLSYLQEFATELYDDYGDPDNADDVEDEVIPSCCVSIVED